jgi:hypothetical protein
MDSRQKAHNKHLAAQAVPGRSPEAAMTEYFLSKYEQHFSKYVSSISFQMYQFCSNDGHILVFNTVC